MNATIKATNGKCSFCTGKEAKEKPVFSLRSESLTGNICGEHLHSYLKQKEEEQAAPENGHAVTT